MPTHTKKASRSATPKWPPSTSKATPSIPNGITPSSRDVAKPRVEAFILRRRLSALLASVGRPRAKRLTAAVEAIVAATLRDQWLVLEAPPLAPVVDEIRARCEEAGEQPPSYGAVQARIPMLFGAIEIAKGRSANPGHVHRLKARPGYIHAPRPLAVCQ